MQTLVVNLFAGPGTGKSTTAAGVFYKLKQQGVSAEIVHEFAKDLTWEERHKALSYQPYIAGKQSYHVHRLIGKVDVIITDSPILLSMIYKGPGYTNGLGDHLLKTFFDWNTFNVFINRDNEHHPYVDAGRNQTLEEAVQVDYDIVNLLEMTGVPYCIIPMADDTVDEIVEGILEKLQPPES